MHPAESGRAIRRPALPCCALSLPLCCPLSAPCREVDLGAALEHVMRNFYPLRIMHLCDFRKKVLGNVKQSCIFGAMEANTATANKHKYTMKNEKPMASAIFALESIVNLQGSNLHPEVLKTLVEAIDNIKTANRQEYNQKMAAVNMLLS